MPKLADVRVRDRFDQRDVWGGLADDPKIQLRTRMFEEMIPHDVEPILDVGCGEGAITNRLARTREVVGVDTSSTALSHLETTAIEASATRLPLADDSFDLVLSSEMLEHMPRKEYVAALAEMRRVTRRYLLISVPYREDLAFRNVRCPGCNWRGRVWGHRQSLTGRIAHRRSRRIQRGRDAYIRTATAAEMARLVVTDGPSCLRCYYYAPGQHPLCERCGNTDFTGQRGIHSALQRINRLLQSRSRPTMPFSLAVLAVGGGQ